MSARYTNCSVCGKTFSVSYFSRHKCKNDDVPHDQHPMNFNQNSETFENESENSGLCCEDENESGSPEDQDHVNDLNEEEHGEDLNEEDFGFLFPEIFAENYPNNQEDPNEKDSGVLIKWLCLFLAYWQMHFSITDTALEFLIKFISVFLKKIDMIQSSEILHEITDNLPSTLYKFYQLLQIEKFLFKKYVVCIKCHSLYELANCCSKYRNEFVSVKCSFKKFPHHRTQHLRKRCGQDLMKTIKSPSGGTMLIPFKTFCYRSLKQSLQLFLQRKTFEDDCNKWKSRNTLDGVYSDVYDGSIWQRLQRNGEWYFQQNRNYAVMLNIDWFQPYQHLSSFSVGGIYMVFMNLPREIRFKKENVVLVGIIPNMDKEPPTNTFVKPLIDELNMAWNEGFKLFSSKTQKYETYHVALLCVGCDIPASRKLCGFLGHQATHGCSKCNKTFPGAIGNKDYGGFDSESWPKRTTQQHRDQMEEILECTSAGDQEKCESSYGTRYSVLAELPYYDTIRMSPIDPMHNLFMGTSKLMIKIWKELGFINRNTQLVMQDRVDKFIVPSDIGKIPRKIVSGFDGFTADEYKNWTILFSVFCLHDCLPSKHLDCFRKFVLACQYFCKETISQTDAIIAHNLIIQFCKTFERLYGRNRVTPNMHLHAHLKDCIFDFGPVYTFWLFSFERYNGILGNISTNNHNIEIQLMNRFCRDICVVNIEKPSKFFGDFASLLSKLDLSSTQKGTLKEINISGSFEVAKMSSRFTNPQNQIWYGLTNCVTTKKENIYSLTSLQLSHLKSTYKFLYPLFDFNDAIISSSCYISTEVIVSGTSYGSLMSRNSRSANIIAYWTGENGDILPLNDIGLCPRPGVVEYFIKHVIWINDQAYEHWFSFCKWFLPVRENVKNMFGKPIEVWHKNHFENMGPSSFIPVQRIFSKFVYADFSHRSCDLIVVAPRLTHSLIPSL